MNESLRSVLRQHCLVEKAKDIDAGAKGKAFERTMLRAFDLVGLDFEKNRDTGAVWDFKPVGDGWEKLIANHDVNIKVAGARWMFSASSLTKALPWDEIDDIDEYDLTKAAAKVRRILVRKGIPQLTFLKPKDKDVQGKIIQAVKDEDIESLDGLLVKKNFKISKLGRNFKVRVSTKDNRIGSIAVDQAGKVFMRSERPRIISGSRTVGFRAPRDALKRIPVGSVKKSYV